MKRTYAICLVMLACVCANAANIVFDLNAFNASPATNRTVVLQPLSPFVGNPQFFTSDTNGVFTNNNMALGVLFNGIIKAPPGQISFQIYLPSDTSGTQAATNYTSVGGIATYPAGAVAPSIQMADARYARSGISLSNTFYLNNNPSNYFSGNQVTNYANAIYSNNPAGYLVTVPIAATNSFLVSVPVAATNWIQTSNNLIAMAGAAVSGSNYLLTVPQGATNWIVSTNTAILWAGKAIAGSNYLITVPISATNWLGDMATANSNQILAMAGSRISGSNYLLTVPLSATNWLGNLATASSNQVIAMAGGAIAGSNYLLTVPIAATNAFSTYNQLTNAITVTSNALASSAGVSLTTVTNVSGQVVTNLAILSAYGLGTNTTLVTAKAIGVTNLTAFGTTDINSNSITNILRMTLLGGVDIKGHDANGFASDSGVSIGRNQGQIYNEVDTAIFGGSANDAGAGNTGGTILGGHGHAIQFSSFTGSADYGTIVGGVSNLVYGIGGFASGIRAAVGYQNYGSWVWNAYNNSYPSYNQPQFASTAAGQFLINAYGGVGINTNALGGMTMNVLGSINATNLYVNGVPVTFATVGAGSNVLVTTNGSVYTVAANSQTNNFTSIVYSNPATSFVVPSQLITATNFILTNSVALYYPTSNPSGFLQTVPMGATNWIVSTNTAILWAGKAVAGSNYWNATSSFNNSITNDYNTVSGVRGLTNLLFRALGLMATDGADANNPFVQLGYSSTCGFGGLAIGNFASGETGIVIGNNAVSRGGSYAIGNLAQAYNDGLTIGDGISTSDGIAIGIAQPSASVYGIAIGSSSVGTHGGIAIGIGVNSDGNGNVAIGADTNGVFPTSSSLFGSNWTHTVELGIGRASVQGALNYHGVGVIDTNGIHIGNGFGLTNLPANKLVGTASINTTGNAGNATNFNGLTTNQFLAILGSNVAGSNYVSFNPFPALQYSTNIIGIYSAGIIAANGTYQQTVTGTWTNVAANGSSVVYVNPTYYLRTNNVALYSTPSLAPNSTWVNVIGVTAPPTNSGFGFVFNHAGLLTTNVNASGIAGIIPMFNLDLTQVATNGNNSFNYAVTNETRPVIHTNVSSQFAGTFRGNGILLTNIASTNIVGGITTNLQFSLGTSVTNTLYFTNGILMRVTTP